MRIMLTGDVVGRPGRKAFMEYTPKLRREKNIDVVIVNGENSAGGKGFTRKAVDELYRGGADIITSGNHVWDKKDVLSFIDQEPFLVRPANYPEGTPGKGWCLFPFKAKNIGVMNLSGTHTHIQTADDRLLPKGTAYITDLGMVGPWNSVLGVKSEIILRKFTTAMPCRFDVEENGPMVYSAVIVDIDDNTNKTSGIERLLIVK